MKSYLDRIIGTLTDMAEDATIAPHLRIRAADQARQAVKLRPKPIKRRSAALRALLKPKA